MGLKRGQVGDLNRRITLRRRQDVPTGSFGIEPVYTDAVQLWAKVEIMASTVPQDGQQIDEVATHRIWLRYRTDVTVDHEIIYNGKTHRVLRETDWEDRRRYTIVEVKELHG